MRFIFYFSFCALPAAFLPSGASGATRTYLSAVSRQPSAAVEIGTDRAGPGGALTEEHQPRESSLVDGGVARCLAYRSRGCVFSRQVHMERDSLCLPAAVALLRPWLNGSAAICFGPACRERNCALPTSVIVVWM